MTIGPEWAAASLLASWRAGRDSLVVEDMTTRWFKRRMPSVIAVVIVLIASVVLAVPSTAGARMEEIHGDLRCAVGAAQMHFDPSVVFAGNNPNPSKSRNAFTALVTGCRGTAPTSPAPGGIYWGVIELKGRLRQNSCLDLTSEGPGARGYFMQGPQRVKLTWYDASGARLGRSNYGGTRGLTLIYDDYSNNAPISPIATVPFTSMLRSRAKAFGGEAVSVRVPIDLTDFSVRCGGGPVAAVPLLGGGITIGNPS
jgi:hypothetical protein